MSETTRTYCRVPSSVILGVDDETESLRVLAEGPGVEREGVLSELCAAMTWKLCREGTVSREDLSKEAMVSVVRELLA